MGGINDWIYELEQQKKDVIPVSWQSDEGKIDVKMMKNILHEILCFNIIKGKNIWNEWEEFVIQ